MLETKLGFGCAPLLGRVNKKDSLNALKFAYELGINYFDIARSYGWGEAESLLGNFLKKEKISRETVEITTKFGLVPHNNQFVRIAKTLARNLTHQIPKTQTIVKSAASKVAPKVDFSVKNTIDSLDKSLKALDTDYIDNILFHGYNFRVESIEIFPIIEFLETQKNLGKIKKYGFATYESLDLLDSFFSSKNIKPDLLQIPCRAIHKYDSLILQQFTKNNIKIVMHSPFKLEPSIKSIYEQFSNQKLFNQVESILGKKIHKIEDVYEIILSYFQNIYSPYVIVNSMFNPQHIKKNQETIKKRTIDQEQFKSFEKLLLSNNII